MLIKWPEKDLFFIHAQITQIVQASDQYGCFTSMLGVYTPLPLRNEPHSITQQRVCLRDRIDEIIVALMLNDELGLNFDRDSLLDIAVRIGKTMLAYYLF